MQKTSVTNHILTIGGATQDITFTTPEALVLNNPKHELTRQKLLAFEFGAKINIKDVHLTFGGGAANTAVNFRKLGFPVTTQLCVGQDKIGDQIINNLEKHRIITKYIQKSNKKKSAFSCVILTKEKTIKRAKRPGLSQERPGRLAAQDGERTLFTYRGANEDLKITNFSHKGSLSGQFPISNFQWIFISSLSQKHWSSDLNSIFKHNTQANIAWNPGNLQLKAGLNSLSKFIKDTDIFIVNKDEALELLKSINGRRQLPLSHFKSSNNPRNIIKELQKFVGGILLLTDGPGGAYSFYDKQLYYEPTLKIKEVDTTGVGDAFGSTFIAGLEFFKGDIQKSLNLAMKQATSVLKEYGAQQGLLTKKELLK